MSKGVQFSFGLKLDAFLYNQMGKVQVDHNDALNIASK